MTHEEKRQYFIDNAVKGDKMQVVDLCKGSISYAIVIRALNNSSKYKSKKEQMVIDTAYQYAKHGRNLVQNDSLLEG